MDVSDVRHRPLEERSCFEMNLPSSVRTQSSPPGVKRAKRKSEVPPRADDGQSAREGGERAYLDPATALGAAGQRFCGVLSLSLSISLLLSLSEEEGFSATVLFFPC